MIRALSVPVTILSSQIKMNESFPVVMEFTIKSSKLMISAFIKEIKQCFGMGKEELLWIR